MTTYTGRQQVEAGLYLNTTTYAIQTLDKTGTLAGTELEHYRRIPMVVMLAAAPLLGLAYVMFLPLIGFAMVLRLLGTKLMQFAGTAAAQVARVARPSWAPALAFLSRTKPVKHDAPAAEKPADAWRENVEKKLDDDEHTS